MNSKLQKLHDFCGLDKLQPKQTVILFCLLHFLFVLVINLLLKNPRQDTIEMMFIGREMVFGYHKHPTLPSILSEIGFRLAGKSATGVYVVLALLSLAAYYYVYMLAKFIFPKDEWLPVYSVICLTILPANFDYRFYALNHCTVMVPFCAAFCYYAYRSYNFKKIPDWIGLGVAAGLAMNSHYMSSVLIFCFGMLCLVSKNRKKIFLSMGPYIAGLTAILVLSPHIYFLISNDFPTFKHADVSHSIVKYDYFGNIINYLSEIITELLVLLLLILSASKQIHWKMKRDNLFILIMGVLPFIIGFLVVLLGDNFSKRWTLAFYNMIGITLLYSFDLKLDKKRFVFLVFVLFLTIATTFTILKIVKLNADSYNNFPAQKIVNIIKQQVGEKDISYISGDYFLAGSLAIKLESRPSVVFDGNVYITTWIDQDKFYNSNVIYIWDSEMKPQFVPNSITVHTIEYNDISNYVAKDGSKVFHWAFKDAQQD